MKEKEILSDYSENTVIVDGIAVRTYEKEFVSANILGVSVGTTGYRGGDSGHGGRTYLRIEDLASSDIDVNVTRGYANNEFISASFSLGGDCELDTFIEALEFAVEALKEQRSKK